MEDVMRCAEPAELLVSMSQVCGDVVFVSDSKSYCFLSGFDIRRSFLYPPADSLCFAGHTATVTCLSVSPASSANKLVSGAVDTSVRVWDLNTGDQLEELYGHCEQVNAVSISPDERFVASVGQDGRLNVWSGAGNTLLFEQVFEATPSDVAFTRDSRHLIVAFKGGRVLVWEIRKNQFVHRLEVLHDDGEENQKTLLVQYSPPGLIISGQRQARGWLIDSGKEKFNTSNEWGSITEMNVTSDFRHVVCCYAATGSVMWWPIVSGAPLAGANYGKGILSFALSSNRCFVTVSSPSWLGTYFVPAAVKSDDCTSALMG